MIPFKIPSTNYSNQAEVRVLLSACMWGDEARISGEIQTYADSPTRELLGFMRDGKLAGLIGVRYDADHLEHAVLAHIAVHPDFRRQGLGRSMVMHVMHHRQITGLKAETDHDAVGFYRSLGFSVTSLARNTRV